MASKKKSSKGHRFLSPEERQSELFPIEGGAAKKPSKKKKAEEEKSDEAVA